MRKKLSISFVSSVMLLSTSALMAEDEKMADVSHAMKAFNEICLKGMASKSATEKLLKSNGWNFTIAGKIPQYMKKDVFLFAYVDYPLELGVRSYSETNVDCMVLAKFKPETKVTELVSKMTNVDGLKGPKIKQKRSKQSATWKNRATGLKGRITFELTADKKDGSWMAVIYSSVKGKK